MNMTMTLTMTMTKTHLPGGVEALPYDEVYNDPAKEQGAQEPPL